jgi:hypothetical protein
VAMPAIDLSDEELAAITALIRRAVEDDRFPLAPRAGMGEAARGTDQCRGSSSTGSHRSTWARAAFSISTTALGLALVSTPVSIQSVTKQNESEPSSDQPLADVR